MLSISRALITGVFLLMFSGAPANSISDLDYAHLKQAIQSESIGSFDELLTFFNRSPLFEKLIENPVLNERSKALHAKFVSATFPRIIMHGGNLTMMVLGDPRLDESQFLEIIEFLPATQTFAFRVVNFHAKGTDEEFINDANTVDFTKLKDPTFQSAANCFECHQMEAKESRPRWMTGPIWQTPFGAVQNTLYKGSRDFENWKLFQTTYADTVLGARYRALHLGRVKELGDGSLRFEDRPNQNLTNFLDSLNAKRVARIIETSPGFSKFEPAIVASFFSCGEMSAFLPPSEVARRESAVRVAISGAGRGIYARSREKISDLDSEKFAALLQKHEDYRFPKDDPTVVEIDDNEFLQLSDLPLETVLEKAIQSTSDLSLVTGVSADALVNFLPIDLTGFVENGVDFSKLIPEQVPQYLKSRNQKFYPVLAKLRYLLEDSVTELPIFWSVSKSSPFGDSYDFGDDEGGLSQVLNEGGLAERFLIDYPGFRNLFRGNRMVRKTLRVEEKDLCEKLKTAQSLKDVF